MSKGIAFFPWWAIDQLIKIGPVRILPYARKKKPGDQPNTTQCDIDDVLSAYALAPGRGVKKAAILEVDDWKTGEDPELIAPRLFLAREALGFSALSERKLFNSHFGYWCFDNFALSVRGYREGSGTTFGYQTKRRDGCVRYLWSTDEFAFQKPTHVHSPLSPSIEESVVVLLMSNRCPEHWLDAVIEFNRANTDSADVPEHVELVMMKSALERLLGIGSDAAEFQRKLVQVLPAPTLSAFDGPMSGTWSKRWSNSRRPIEAWARDFCDRRNMAAHGGNRKSDRCVWPEFSHLAFASILLPLLLKKLAADAGLRALTRYEALLLERIDQYLLYDPLAPIQGRDGEQVHPWRDIEDGVAIEVLSERMQAHALEQFGEVVASTPANASDDHLQRRTQD